MGVPRVLTRQKAILAILMDAGGALERTAFVKLAFLLRQQPGFQGAGTFYDFVPYKFGPFSFALYREMEALERNGYVHLDEHRISLCSAMCRDADRRAAELSPGDRRLVAATVRRFGRMSATDLLKHVYHTYPWFATRSERRDLAPAQLPSPAAAPPGVYTVGYEGRSVDGFFDLLLHGGIAGVADVRANPVSRKYGFARSSMSRIAGKLGIAYEHLPCLGIPAEARRGLGVSVDREELLARYERDVLPRQREEISRLASIFSRRPIVLVCMEAEPRMCHRLRLAERVAAVSGLPIRHL
jgi:uncharacterized protein (DUF488 family)